MSTNNARILQCTTAEYLNDPLPAPSLSSSLAHTLISRSPLHAWLQHPKLGGKPRMSTREFDRGKAVHSLLLGAGTEIVMVEGENWRTKAAQTARDEARAQGKTPVLQHEFESMGAAVHVLRKKIAKYGIAFDGQSELAVAWDEPSGYGTVQCRAQLDHVRVDHAQIVDLKTCESAKPEACAKHAVDYGYVLQHAAYTRAVGRLYPELTGKVDFVFVFCEIEPPFAVTAARLNGSLREIGDNHWGRAVEIWGHCLHTGKWPAYTADDEIINLEAPPWVIARELGEVA
jgi:hypothetical protein